MDAKLKSMAERAIAKEKPLKGYELGVLDAGIREDSNELIVILLDGRKMIYPLAPPKGGPDMKAKPDPLAKMAEDFTNMASIATKRDTGSKPKPKGKS
jgi:hypothetical protein